METLQTISIKLPNIDSSFNSKFMSALSPFGLLEKDIFVFNKTNQTYKPDVFLRFDDISSSEVTFKTNEKELSIDIINTTGKTIESNHTYNHISIDNYLERIKGLTLLGIDHIGFDLPWFDKGVHPDITMLRTMLKGTTLYHLFPTGEPWDFIIPATEQEIASTTIDYNKTRRPKFEIVSLDKVSTPLFQFDVLVKEPYANLKKLFPEAIHDDELRNMWIYIENPFELDICFVLNEQDTGDWSEFFKNSRLT